MRVIIGFLAAAFFALPLAAQNATVVGSALVDGQRVELLSDQTWRFSEATTGEKGCEALNQKFVNAIRIDFPE